MTYKIYTDGSCLGNPGAGGYAAIIIDEVGGTQEIFGGEKFTTNNRMELTAAITALKKIPFGAYVELFTDSQYLKNAFTQNWLANWKRRGWKAAGGGAVKNQDLWHEIDELISKFHVKFNWVKGHAGNSYNERCDKLARDTALKFQKFPDYKPPVPKIETPPKVEVASKVTTQKIKTPSPKVEKNVRWVQQELF